MSKYHAVPTVVDGIRFASRREAARYHALCLLVRAGEVRDLELQPEYPIHVAGQRVAKYVADFRYRDKSGALVVEDAKGVRTSVYRLKRRCVEAEYGIRVVEV